MERLRIIWTCCDLGVNAHIPDLKRSQQERESRRGIFTEEAFQYDPETDTYLCPAGHHLKKSNYNPKRDAFEYKCSIKVCRNCSLVTQCTTSKYGRSLKRHRRQDDLDKMRNAAQSQTSKKTSIPVSILWNVRLPVQRDMVSSGHVGEDFGGFVFRNISPPPYRTSWCFCPMGKSGA